MLERTYIPTVDGAAFQEALLRDRYQAELLLQREAAHIGRFIKHTLRLEGYGYFSPGKSRRRGELFAQANAAVLEAAGDLGLFTIDMILGSVQVRDLEAEEARRIRKAQGAATSDVSEAAESCFLNSRTGQVRTAEQKNMDILFGRAYPDDFQRSGQSI